MIPYIDIHTHRQSKQADEMAVLSLDYDSATLPLCSVGVHPWFSVKALDNAGFIEESTSLVAQKGSSRDVVAIGEAGLDRLRGADLKTQCVLFERQAMIAEEIHKPLIVHMVKCVDEIVSIYKTLHPSQQWIIHGFRGKAEQARQLMSLGMDLSFGAHFNESSLKLAFSCNRMWLETDDSDISIAEHYRAVSNILSVNVEDLRLNLFERATRLSSAFLPE